jgi:UDP-N-acetylmuramoylalanine--D-glutamate ligase
MQRLKNKKVTVFGMGRSGVAAVNLLQKLEADVYAVNQGDVAEWEHKDGLALSREKLVSQSAASSLFAESELIVISPGIPSTHPVLQAAVAKKVKIISEIELAYQVCSQVPVIAITGTNGKTTTTTMISEALILSGKKVFCGGNIGVPYCEMALKVLGGEKFDYAVIEVSSFQLETIETFHPHVSLMLNLTENHGERYEGLEDYGRAKLHILRNQTQADHLIVGEESGEQWLSWAQAHPMKIHRFSKKRLAPDFLSAFDFSQTRLVGGHNRANFYCAYKTLSLLGLESRPLFQQFINEFKGVSHRLEFVREWEGLKIYNDAKSTNAEAIVTALSAFEGQRDLVLVMGGKLRSENDHFLTSLQPFKNNIQLILTMGETAARLQAEFKEHFKVERVDSLEGLKVRLLKKDLKGVVVFSPGHPSFDQFKNYIDRGEKFKAVMLSL